MGIAGGAMLAGLFVTVLPAGAIIDRVGSRLALGAIMTALGLAFIGVASQQSFWGLVAALFIVGLVGSGVKPAINKTIAIRYAREQRGTTLGLIEAGAPMAGLVGALVLPAVALAIGWNVGYRLIGVAALLSAFVCWVLIPTVQFRRENSRPLFHFVLRNQGTFLILSATYALTVSAVMAARVFLTLFLVDIVNLTAIVAGFYFALTQASAAGGRILWGILADRHFAQNRTGLLSLNTWLSAVSFALLSVLSAKSTPLMIAFVMLLLGISILASWGIMSVLVVDMAGEDSTASATSVILTLMVIAGVLGPIIFGIVVDLTDSYQLALRLFGGVLVLSAVLFARLSHAEKVISTSN